jgi:hypothetical protein
MNFFLEFVGLPALSKLSLLLEERVVILNFICHSIVVKTSACLQSLEKGLLLSWCRIDPEPVGDQIPFCSSTYVLTAVAVMFT